MQFEGIYTPLVTPYHDDFTLNEGALAATVELLISAGVNGIVVAGSTGEYYAQTPEERLEMMTRARDLIAGRVPMIVGTGGHYLGHPHTLEHFQKAFFIPEMLDNNSIEQWQAEGGIEITERALIRARAMLKEYEDPKLDDGVNEALLDYIARRAREIPAADALNQEY